mgnify:FL=1
MHPIRSRIVATAVAVATASSLIVAPQAFADEAPSDSSFVQEKSGTETVYVNGTKFDEDGNLIDPNNAGDTAIEELEGESEESGFSFYDAEPTEATEASGNALSLIHI